VLTDVCSTDQVDGRDAYTHRFSDLKALMQRTQIVHVEVEPLRSDCCGGPTDCGTISPHRGVRDLVAKIWVFDRYVFAHSHVWMFVCELQCGPVSSTDTCIGYTASASPKWQPHDDRN
jgi:hypothetical protein